MTTQSSNLEDYFSGDEEGNDSHSDEDDYSEFTEASKHANAKDKTTASEEAPTKILVTHVSSHAGEEEDSYGSSKPGSPRDALSRSAQELSQAIMEQELDLVHRLQDREKQRTAKVQAELDDLDSQGSNAARIELDRKFDRLMRRANELGIDAKLGFADPQEYTEEECFRLGANLREAEMRLSDLKTKVCTMGQQLARREYEYNKMFNPERKEVEQRLVDFNKRLQAEEEKGSHLNEKLGTLKEGFAKRKGEASVTRDLLLEKLVKDEMKREKYKHICISELARLLIQENDTARYVTSTRSSLNKANSSQRTAGARNLKRLTRELEYLKAKNSRLKAAVEKLDNELEHASKASSQVRSFKGRIVSLLGKQMKEKNLHFLADKATEALDKKVVLLSDHIERLMLHLKHESSDKARAHEAESLALKETDLLRARITALAKKNLRKDTVIVELQEGERILEDQLRLMDGKYVELRRVLNETRSKYKAEIDKYVQEAGRLRVRWERETQGVIPIEYVPLPHPRATSRSSKARSAPSRQSGGGLGFGQDGPQTSYSRVPSAAVPVPLTSHSIGGEGVPLEPWSDEKLTNLQQNLEVQKHLQSGRPLTTGAVGMASAREQQLSPARAPQPSTASPASAPATPAEPAVSSSGSGRTEGHF